MKTRPIERIASLVIGTVEAVSPAEIRVVLDPSAPQATALNTGVPTGFPRINGYVLIPNEAGAVVGLVVWLGVERSQSLKRIETRDTGVVDLPFPVRRITLTPLGTLTAGESAVGSERDYRLERGVSAFPSVGDAVQLPTIKQLRCIVEASREEDKRVRIGTSPLAANAAVTVDPDKVFGRHLAVLGNTGSGKSCSVAGLIRWSLAAAKKARPRADKPNARFIILDPNGEYSAAFADYQDVRRFEVSPKDIGVQPLLLPAWMWNSHEWAAFAHASPAVQRPLLLQALRDLRSGARIREPVQRQAARLIRSYKDSLTARISRGTGGYQGFRESKNCGHQLRMLATDSESYAEKTQGGLASALVALAQGSTNLAESRYWKGRTGDGYNDFCETDIRAIIGLLDEVLAHLPQDKRDDAVSEDAPVEFALSALPDYLDQIASEAPASQAAQFVATLTMRIRMMLGDNRLGPVVNPNRDRSTTFQQWLESTIGKEDAANGEIAIVDLSLVPSEVLHVIIAVVARIVFEAAQRYRKINETQLPTVLVLEEAHTFVRRTGYQDSDVPTPAQMCCTTFERIAREGRKFGLGLVLSSQRPSELSPTVLAQCNTFLLHRIVNDQDQELVGKLVPDNLGGLLKELPSLPSRQAILLGWAAAVPTLVEITELPPEQRPQSADPRFWDVWTGQQSRRIRWDEIVEDWTGLRARSESTQPPQPAGDE